MEGLFSIKEEDPLTEYTGLTDDFDYKELTTDEEKRSILNKIIIRTFELKTIYDSEFSQCMSCNSYTSNYCGSCSGCLNIVCKNKNHRHIKSPDNKCCLIL